MDNYLFGVVVIVLLEVIVGNEVVFRCFCGMVCDKFVMLIF